MESIQSHRGKEATQRSEHVALMTRATRWREGGWVWSVSKGSFDMFDHRTTLRATMYDRDPGSQHHQSISGAVSLMSEGLQASTHRVA